MKPSLRLGVLALNMRYFGLLSALLMAAPTSARSQVTVVDEGSFTISRSGARIGRETFTIRRTPGPGGDVYVANATVEFDAEDVVRHPLVQRIVNAYEKYERKE